MDRQEEITQTLSYIEKIWRANPTSRLLQLLVLSNYKAAITEGNWHLIDERELVNGIKNELAEGYLNGE